MPELKQRISDEVKAALLGGDRFRGDTLRNLKAAILDEEVSKMKRDEGLSDAETEAVIVREVKKRKESVKLYRDNGRLDLAEPEEREMAILQEFLPEQMSEDDIRKVVEQAVAGVSDASIQQMGQVIGAVKASIGASADGAVIARIVKEILG